MMPRKTAAGEVNSAPSQSKSVTWRLTLGIIRCWVTTRVSARRRRMPRRMRLITLLNCFLSGPARAALGRSTIIPTSHSGLLLRQGQEGKVVTIAMMASLSSSKMLADIWLGSSAVAARVASAIRLLALATSTRSQSNKRRDLPRPRRLRLIPLVMFVGFGAFDLFRMETMP